MKLFKITLVLAFLAVMLIINGCSNSTSTTNPQNFFLVVSGNYWVYATYNLDTAGVKDMTSMTTDSTVITGTQTLYGKNSFIFTTYNSKTGSKTQNFYTENGKLYTAVSSVIPDTTQFPLPLNIPNAWVVVADPDSASWTIFSQALNNADFPVPGYGTAKLTGTFAIRGEKGSQSTMQTGENQTISVSAQEYRMIFSFNGTITIPGVPIPMTLNFAVTNHSWYGVNIGLIQSKTDPSTISVGGGLITQKIQGTESDMLRYHVNP
jgi:hypothetical protein